MMKRKLIEKISIISFVCAVILTSGGITLGSYLKYKKYRDEISANRVNNEPVLQSIDVQLKKGKNFYKMVKQFQLNRILLLMLIIKLEKIEVMKKH